MQRLPDIERDHTSGSLLTTSAIEWCTFVAEEAHWNNDIETHDDLISLRDRLKRHPKGSVYSRTLEDAIERYRSSQAYSGPCFTCQDRKDQ